jgi:hypothetical protein
MFRILAAIGRFLIIAPLAIGQSFWQTLVAAMAAIKPTPYTPSDIAADEAEAALAEDDAVASAEERRAAREARRAQASLSPEIAHAVAEQGPFKTVPPVTDAEVEHALKAAKFKFNKPKELRGFPHPVKYKAGEDFTEARTVQRFLFNHLANGLAYAVPPSLQGLPAHVVDWVKSLDRDQRKGVVLISHQTLHKHLFSDNVADWSGELPPLSPERARIHRQYVERRGGRYYNPAREGRISIQVLPPRDVRGTLEEAEDAFGPYVRGR